MERDFTLPGAGAGQLVGQDIVCLALRQWDAPWKNNQQVMSTLARTNRVLYVGPQRSFRESLLQIRDGARSGPAMENAPEGLYLYQEPWFLARLRQSRRGAEIVNRITRRGRLAQVHQLCCRLKFKAPILWVYDPGSVYAVGTFGEQLVVYHVIDNYEHWTSGPSRFRAQALRNHRAMLKRADVVFAVSEALQQQCLSVNLNSHLVPNGVDYPLFESAMRSKSVPGDMVGIPHPIIGYVGVLQPRIDLDVLCGMAAGRPDWSFVLVGPFEFLDRGDATLRAFFGLHNVHYLGPKRREDIPRYMSSCDVGILPYRDDDLTAYLDSLKLYEYLAAGLPVVSSDVPSSRRFIPLIHIARSTSEFIAAVEASLLEGSTRTTERRTLAARHSWDRRIEQMSVLVADTLAHSKHDRPTQ